jgi:hypothetical protein
LGLTSELACQNVKLRKEHTVDTQFCACKRRELAIYLSLHLHNLPSDPHPKQHTHRHTPLYIEGCTINYTQFCQKELDIYFTKRIYARLTNKGCVFLGRSGGLSQKVNIALWTSCGILALLDTLAVSALRGVRAQVYFTSGVYYHGGCTTCGCGNILEQLSETTRIFLQLYLTF